MRIVLITLLVSQFAFAGGKTCSAIYNEVELVLNSKISNASAQSLNSQLRAVLKEHDESNCREKMKRLEDADNEAKRYKGPVEPWAK